MGAEAFEQHYTVPQLAARWGYSPATIRNLFRDEPGVIRLRIPTKLNAKCQRYYASIPAPIARAVYERLQKDSLRAAESRIT